MTRIEMRTRHQTQGAYISVCFCIDGGTVTNVHIMEGQYSTPHRLIYWEGGMDDRDVVQCTSNSANLYMQRKMISALQM